MANHNKRLDDLIDSGTVIGIGAGHGAALPLILYGPDGHPTGDRLPG